MADEELRKRVCTGRAALVACMRCRAAVSRGCDDLADQLQANPPRPKQIQCLVGLPAGSVRQIGSLLKSLGPGVVRTVQVPTGAGTLVAYQLCGSTSLAELDIGSLTRTQVQAAILVLRSVATATRDKARDCCYGQIKRALLSQSKPKAMRLRRSERRGETPRRKRGRPPKSP